MKNIRIFFNLNIFFLVVKFSVYLKRRVFVMLTPNIQVLVLKFEPVHLFMCLNTDKIANSVDPVLWCLIWVCTICSGLARQICKGNGKFCQN